MKKLIAGLFAAVLTTAGLVSVSGTAASAAPYPGTVKTQPTAVAPKTVKAGKKLTVKVAVKAGATKAKGQVIVTVKLGKKTVSKTTKAYKGKAVKVSSKKLKKAGKYTVTISFKPAKGSVYKASKVTKKFKVRK